MLHEEHAPRVVHDHCCRAERMGQPARRFFRGGHCRIVPRRPTTEPAGDQFENEPAHRPSHPDRSGGQRLASARPRLLAAGPRERRIRAEICSPGAPRSAARSMRSVPARPSPRRNASTVESVWSDPLRSIRFTVGWVRCSLRASSLCETPSASRARSRMRSVSL